MPTRRTVPDGPDCDLKPLANAKAVNELPVKPVTSRAHGTIACLVQVLRL
jgi:hypothetical protein